MATALASLQNRPGPLSPDVADLQRRHTAAATRAAALHEQLTKRGWTDGL